MTSINVGYKTHAKAFAKFLRHKGITAKAYRATVRSEADLPRMVELLYEHWDWN